MEEYALKTKALKEVMENAMIKRHERPTRNGCATATRASMCSTPASSSPTASSPCKIKRDGRGAPHDEAPHARGLSS